jgi:phenylalanyl-tRNA synthetase beta chain
MLERGRPLHAFDLACARAGSSARCRRRAFTTLDSVAAADARDLVIADGAGPVAIAGVMGGQESESGRGRRRSSRGAFFRPRACAGRRAVWGCCRRRRTDSSAGVDRPEVAPALDAVAAMIARLAGGSVAPGVVRAEAIPTLRRARSGSARARRLAAQRAAAKAETRAACALGAVLGDGAVLVVAPPSHRGDLQIEEDLIEGRTPGRLRVDPDAPGRPLRAGEDSPARVLCRVRTLLVAEG